LNLEKTLEKNERNWRFDVLKCIACIVVILLHSGIPGEIGRGIAYGLRFSVPIFFMITGYYSYSKDNKWILKKALGIGKMIFFTELIYGLYDVLVKVIYYSTPIEEYIQSLNNFDLLKILFFGSFFNGTLWYLYAAFWTFIIIVFLRKIHIYQNDILVFTIIFVLISIQIQGLYYFRTHYDIPEYKIHLFRSAFLFGVPLELLGAQFAKHSEKIIKYFSYKKTLSLFLIGFILILAECIFSRKYLEFHYSTAFISSGMFIFAMVHKGNQLKLFKVMSYIGRELSMWVYLAHIMIIKILSSIINLLNLNNNMIVSYLKPILAIIVTCIIAELIQKCNKYFHKKHTV